MSIQSPHGPVKTDKSTSKEVSLSSRSPRPRQRLDRRSWNGADEQNGRRSQKTPSADTALRANDLRMSAEQVGTARFDRSLDQIGSTACRRNNRNRP